MVRRILYAVAALACLLFLVDVVSAVRQIGRVYPGFVLTDVLSYTNTARGFNAYDTLDTANGKALKTNQDLQDVIEGVPLGTPVTYGYTRDGKVHEFTERTRHFSWGDFGRELFPYLIVGLPYLLIGIACFRLKPDMPAARAHLLLTATYGLASSNYVEFAWGSLLKPWNEPFAVTLIFLQAAAMLHLVLVFPARRRILDRFPHTVAWVWAGAAALCLFAYSFWVRQYLKDGTFEVPVMGTPTLSVAIAGSLLVTNCLGYLALLEASFRAPTLVARRQSRVTLLGALGAYLPNLFLMILPMLFNYRVPYNALLNALSLASPLLFPLAIAYAIVRHKLFDIDLVIKRTVVYGSVVGFLGALYFAAMTGVGVLLASSAPAQAAAAGAAGSTPNAANLAASAIVAVAFAPLRDRIRAWVDARFFRAGYQFDQVVAEFGEALRTGAEAKALLAPYLLAIGRSLHPAYLAVLFRPESADELVLVESVGLPGIEGLVLPLDHPVIADLRVRNAAVADGAADFGPLSQALCIPLSISGRIAGCVLAGPRKSGLEYEPQDRLLLATLAQQYEKRLEQDELDRADADASRARTALSRYVSAQVADTVLQEHFDFAEGRRQEVTLLFSDIRGFTQMSETMPPEEVVTLLNGYFERMVRAVFAHDGMLDKFIGDGMMVVFGAPIPRADHAWRATKAALAMREELALLNAARAADGQDPLKIGIGLHTGEVVIGNIGSELRLDFTAIGDTVNTASRIESLTKEHAADILLSDATYQLVRDRVRVRAIPGVAIRGRDQALDLYALDAATPGATPA
jgi:class 3 adenylate cyclase